MILKGLVIAVLSVVLAVVGLCLAIMKRRAMDRWIFSYIAQGRKRRSPSDQDPVHLLLCIADHYEPMRGRPSPEIAARRVQSWTVNYPRLFDRFRDADGQPPRHTFFFPIDEYDPAHVDSLAQLCRRGYGEIEIHHHHDNDTSEALRQRLLDYKKLFRERHGLLPQRRDDGQVMYGFVHGNWALNNCRKDGRHCGVNNELDVLRETGCYADFTFPSAPSETQPSKINSIYYASNDSRPHEIHKRGVNVGARQKPDRSLMLVQGPLSLDWRPGHGRFLPRIENACLQGNQPPTTARLDLWLKSRVQIPARPDWFFVKLHTHGAPEENQAMLLGAPMVHFHEALAERARYNSHFHFHYVTAREMYNLVKAAEAGFAGSVGDARDFELVWRP